MDEHKRMTTAAGVLVADNQNGLTAGPPGAVLNPDRLTGFCTLCTAA
jgi:catalase